MSQPTFIDVFSGCGGLSLGMMSAGWRGLFAVEKNPDAFATIKYNLIDQKDSPFHFAWPNWLPQQPMTSQDLLKEHKDDLSTLQEQVDLIVGGPPCQGFSLAGRRKQDDPRNTLTEEYLQVVEKVQPRFLLIENVHGFAMAFKNGETPSGKAYSNIVQEKLEGLGYSVFTTIVDCSDFGVPQRRKRFIMLSIRNDDAALTYLNGRNPFDLIIERAKLFRESKGLSGGHPCTSKEAISDLETENSTLVPCTDSPIDGFLQVCYKNTNHSSAYQKLMRSRVNGSDTNSLRIPQHRDHVIEQFHKIQTLFPRGKSLSKDARDSLGIKKRSITTLHPEMPSPTITTLPDDILHYSEPRILTVRENARLQSFPDWFTFQGKYTTGGKKRKRECPRYTQVGNAVPPLLAEAIGEFILELSEKRAEAIVHKIEQELRDRRQGWWDRLQTAIPELTPLASTQQPPKYHAEGNVAVHTQLAIAACPASCDPDLLWAALLHDIGKPATTKINVKSIKAHGHDKAGALIAEKILTRLGMPNQRKERIVWAVRHHQLHHSWQLKNINNASNKHKKLVAMVDFPFLLELIKVDALASQGHPDGLSTYEFYKRFRQSIEMKLSK